MSEVLLVAIRFIASFSHVLNKSPDILKLEPGCSCFTDKNDFMNMMMKKIISRLNDKYLEGIRLHQSEIQIERLTAYNF